MKSLRSHLTYANVISTLCLFLLLGGGAAFAATQLAKNSVGPKQLKKNAVTTAKIKNGAVTAAKIKNGAVTGAKVETSSLGTVPTATNSDSLGGVAAAGYQRTAMWALVEQDGVILDQSGGISMQAISGSGGYWMHFPQAVTHKGIAVTPWSGWEPEDPAVEVTPCGGEGNPGGVDCAQGTNTTSDLFVGTQENAGTPQNAAFYVLVLP